ncbi:MAG: site-specific integrase [Candidatus Bathyarchaeota archaeon]|nr:site-specific integrase [Candidatus Bathyarchaeota archaeon]
MIAPKLKDSLKPNQKKKEISRTTKWETLEYLKFDSIKNWFESLEQTAMSRNKKFTKSARNNRTSVIIKFSKFTGLNPDQLLEEAKKDIKNATSKITDFFNWMVDDKKLVHNSAVTQIGFIRGFYTHNDLFFPKRFGTPQRTVSQVAQRDRKVKIYDYDEVTDKMIFNNGTLQQFIQNLNFRDQTITLCLLSTGADATDLLKLNIEFVKDGKGDTSKTKRFLWSGNRSKDGVPFKVYFSEEATQFLKRYVEQEKAGAKDKEPLFLGREIKKGEQTIRRRLEAHALAINYRKSAKKMGYVKKKLSQPFRPKRFRHLFRTACANANIDIGFINAMMGHKTTVSGSYLERSEGLLLKEYLKVEPYLTVFGLDKSKVTKLGEEMEELRNQVLSLVKQNEDLKSEIGSNKAYIQDLIYQVHELNTAYSQLSAYKENEETTKENPIPKKQTKEPKIKPTKKTLWKSE